MGDMVDSGIRLSYRPASLCSLVSRYDNPMPESTLTPQSESVNLATVERGFQKKIDIFHENFA
jgi:hypothetical protein